MAELAISDTELNEFAERAINLPREDAQELRDKVNVLRERLEKHIVEHPGFSLVKMLHAGSVAKGTALRTVNDLDVAVYVRKDDAPVEEGALVDWLAARLRDAYHGLLKPDQIQPEANARAETLPGVFGDEVASRSFIGPGKLLRQSTGMPI